MSKHKWETLNNYSDIKFEFYNGIAKVIITNAKDSYALLGYLGSVCNKSLSSYLLTDKLSALISPGSRYPLIYSASSCKKIELTCSKNKSLIDMSFIEGLDPEIDESKQKSFYELALKNGLSISTLNYVYQNNSAPNP